MRLSMAIQEPAPNRQARCIDKSHFELHDVLHVQAKFPFAPQYLSERLGRAVSSRRQYFTYRELHHDKLAKGVDKLGLEAAKTEFTASSTEATTLRRADSLSIMDGDDDALSMTSYATSVNATLRAPNLPKEAREKEHYNCPLCYGLVAIHTTTAWKRHVYQDLHPYCCTYKECSTADRLYDSRHAWFAHEVEAHRSIFQCVEGCLEGFEIERDFEDHVRSRHEDLAAPGMFSALKRTSIKSPALTDMTTCGLCNKRMSLRALQKHLGHHHEQLALFAIPSNLDETVDDEGEEEQGSLLKSGVAEEDNDEEVTDTSDASGAEDLVIGDDVEKAISGYHSFAKSGGVQLDNKAEGATPDEELNKVGEVPGTEAEVQGGKDNTGMGMNAMLNAQGIQDHGGGRNHDDSEENEWYSLANYHDARNVRKSQPGEQFARRTSETLAPERYYASDLHQSRHAGPAPRPEDSGAEPRTRQLLEDWGSEDGVHKHELQMEKNREAQRKSRMEVAEQIDRDAADALIEADERDLEDADRRERTRRREMLKFSEFMAGGKDAEARIRHVEERIRADLELEREREQTLGGPKAKAQKEQSERGTERERTILTEFEQEQKDRAWTGDEFETPIRRRLQQFNHQANMVPHNPQPVYAKIRREYLDIETLHYYDIPYRIDDDPNYIIVLREMDPKETDILFEHTRRLRSNHGDRLFVEADGRSRIGKKKARSRDREPSRGPGDSNNVTLGEMFFR
ncbi:uncharacterized protein M421DRAFT_6632 [Didymella exigua CBS 183.55]|uniref:C2H2-type domain-containing protein n=1 Tax=Didymella exigua CBS 183.55 TaxID=1150837 RepID=A0A6A5REN0_9PLEO|nr:uncharacterized protein M421DRAFT_6632 [Didymella exigua CBS 183.55]KAF1926715.1 hypothetical protein M421DRAFT_6632 [Didymella exigua CBS 183.55]